MVAKVGDSDLAAVGGLAVVAGWGLAEEEGLDSVGAMVESAAARGLGWVVEAGLDWVVAAAKGSAEGLVAVAEGLAMEDWG